MEWGIFSDGGMIDGPYYTLGEAQEALAAYPAEEGAEIVELCSDHEGEASEGCPSCYAEED